MKNLWIFGIVLIVVLIAGTYAVVGDMMGDDIVNLLALAGAAAIVVISVVVVMSYVKQMKDSTATGELVDENWDGIGEYNNLAPFGWAISIVIWLTGIYLWHIGDFKTTAFIGYVFSMAGHLLFVFWLYHSKRG